MLGLLLLLAISLQTPTTGLPAASVPATDAPKYVGSKKIVCGDVLGIRLPATQKDDLTRIDLGRAFPEQPVTLLVANSDRLEFATFFENVMRQQFICVEGKIERVKDAVVLKFRSPNQIKAIGPVAKNPRFPANLPVCGSAGTTQPKIVRRVNPKYTSEAMKAKIVGEVTLKIVIREDGSVGEIEVTKSLDSLMGLDDAAIAAALQWTFQPSTKDGRPVACTVILMLDFKLH